MSNDRTTDQDQHEQAVSQWKDEFLADDPPEPTLTEAPAPELSTPPAPVADPAPTPAPEPAAAASTEPATGQPSPASAETPPAPPSAPTQPPVDPPTTPQPEPFTVKADGREFRHEGVTKAPDGSIAFTPDAWRVFQANHVADRGAWREQVQQFRREQADTQTRITAKEEANKVLLDRFQQLVALGSQDIGALAEWVVKTQAELPTFVAQLKDREREAETEALRRQVAEIERERMRPQLEPQWKAGVTQWAERMVAEQPALAGVNAAEAAAHLWDHHRDLLLMDAPEDDPGGAFRRGDPVVNLPVLYKLLTEQAHATARLAAERQKWEQQRAAEAARQQATHQNAVAQRPPTAPATVAATKARTVPTRQKETIRPRNQDGTFAPSNAKQSFEREWDDFDPLAD